MNTEMKKLLIEVENKIWVMRKNEQNSELLRSQAIKLKDLAERIAANLERIQDLPIN